jgi:hypothetical protein
MLRLDSSKEVLIAHQLLWPDSSRVLALSNVTVSDLILCVDCHRESVSIVEI